MATPNLTQYIAIAQSQQYNKLFYNFKNHLFSKTLLWEGGNKMHKVTGDSGGYTLYGIAYNYNKDLFANFSDFADTVYNEAAAVAFCRYYLTAQCNRLPYSSQLMYFDMCYNLGVSTAIKLMQKCAGLTPDGQIGPLTRAAMQHITVQCLAEQRRSRYYAIVKANKKLQKFLNGWLNRTAAIQRASNADLIK